jgi:hypothetical protein
MKRTGSAAGWSGWSDGAYDLDDGNHRAIAAFLAGRRAVVAFVGHLDGSR